MASQDVAASPPPPNAGESPEVAEARAIMADEKSGYREGNPEAVAKVGALMAKAYPPEAPTPAPPPKPEVDPVAAWREAVDQTEPDLLPPKTPKEIRDVVPKTASEYEFVFPGVRAEADTWDNRTVDQFLAGVAVPARLTNGMVEDVLNLHRTFVTSIIREGGADALVNEVNVRKLVDWAVRRNWSRAQFERAYSWALDWATANEARLRTIPDTSALEDEQRELMISSAYKNQSDPKSRAVRARVSELAKEIVKRKGGRL